MMYSIKTKQFTERLNPPVSAFGAMLNRAGKARQITGKDSSKVDVRVCHMGILYATRRS